MYRARKMIITEAQTAVTAAGERLGTVRCLRCSFSAQEAVARLLLFAGSF